MQFAIVIPTYSRITKLKRCIESILKQTHQDFLIFVMADNNDEETYRWVTDTYIDEPRIQAVPIEKHLYVIGCWNYFTKNLFKYVIDYMCWIVDDTELLPDCLETLNRVCTKHFPDKDGMVGISQVYPLCPEVHWKENGQCAIGKKFIERFPNRQVCCPDYVHFYQDEEVLEYAKSINKFVLSTGKLIHHHPAFYRNEMDETHKIPRGETHNKDRATYLMRRKKDLIWGKNWELINDKLRSI